MSSSYDCGGINPRVVVRKLLKLYVGMVPM